MGIYAYTHGSESVRKREREASLVVCLFLSIKFANLNPFNLYVYAIAIV